MRTLTHDIEQKVPQDADHDSGAPSQVPRFTRGELARHSDFQLCRLRYSRATVGPTCQHDSRSQLAGEKPRESSTEHLGRDTHVQNRCGWRH